MRLFLAGIRPVLTEAERAWPRGIGLAQRQLAGFLPATEVMPTEGEREKDEMRVR